MSMWEDCTGEDLPRNEIAVLTRSVMGTQDWDGVDVMIAICDALTSGPGLLWLSVEYPDDRWLPRAAWDKLVGRASELRTLVIYNDAALAALTATGHDQPSSFLPALLYLKIKVFNFKSVEPGREHIPLHDAFCTWVEGRAAANVPLRSLHIESEVKMDEKFVGRLKKAVKGEYRTSRSPMDSDASTRILVVSNSLDQARAAVKRIKAFVDDIADLPNCNPIPWTIKNRYYTADVHFHLVEFSQWTPHIAADVPAVIYVWARGEPYAEHIQSLSQNLERHEPEVVLAIALGAPSTHPSDPPEGPDAFLADHSFEYIDAERAQRTSDDSNPHHEPPSPFRDSETEIEADDSDAPQGLPRVLDALSTIMWPSMVRTHDSSKRKSLFEALPAPSDDPSEDDPTEEETLAALVADSRTRGLGVRGEVAALERWLLENEDLHEHELRETGLTEEEAREAGLGIWHSEDVAVSARSGDASDPWGIAASGPPVPVDAGFDDDFAAFVAAPALSVTGPPTPMPAHAHAQEHDSLQLDAQHLVPMHTGGSYRSLRSTTSSFDPHVDPYAGYEPLEHESIADNMDISLAGDDARAPFDLEDILNSLQSVREEVAGMGDEEQRRAYTARFTSDFVVRRMGSEE
ncbi:hypothetical protein BV25DRAFT_1921266 [Artomyces pyxidatus]|uniref:Uncharacterized protein n=1 Tax=Artomyces pyxidatus TaxID=48021 RepID=A0ACB8SJJ8_9AGAM|nr:hypothetical protein BV25DRAFT_1921266 [Artomyces pyxidatus]